MELCTDWGTGR